MDTLESTRRVITETAFQEHEFPAEVVGANGWDYDGLDTFKRLAFLARETAPFEPVIFYVEFEAGSARVRSTGCLSSDVNAFGG